MSTPVQVLHVGIGNTGSVLQALEAVGANATLTEDPKAIASAERLVFPGQGAFAVLRALQETGLADAMREFFATGRPYFGICLGLQVLFEESKESPGTPGLGLLPGVIERLEPRRGEKIPHIGWNDVEIVKPDPLFASIESGADFYFAHSFAAKAVDDDCCVLRCHYADDFVAAVRKDNLFASQFHPEKSQDAGLRLLRNFVEL